ncbi:Uncharacterised protein [Porphyromonas crevioricanis]|uniref:Uncharacterized protein n=1 Tax=Porphyromonas crevioricanis TaxID=393921 RepID=A0A2X4PLA3_9PORP|nr:Uncharacterised protein [Porphyromonas crevioricanis]
MKLLHGTPSSPETYPFSQEEGGATNLYFVAPPFPFLFSTGMQIIPFAYTCIIYGENNDGLHHPSLLHGRDDQYEPDAPVSVAPHSLLA